MIDMEVAVRSNEEQTVALHVLSTVLKWSIELLKSQVEDLCLG